MSRLRDALHPHGGGQRDAGIISLYMALVVTFALVAVLELTRTWFGAMSINTNVATVDARLQPIEQNTSQIALLMRTTTTAGKIVESTKPLNQQAGEVNKTVTSINKTARSINDKAVSINDRVRDITATAQEINTTVDQLGGTVGSIEANALSIEGSASSINGSFAELLPVTRQINGEGFPDPIGIDSINDNVDVVIELARDIESDLDAIRGSVINIDQHAESIDNAPLLELENSLVPLPQLAGSLGTSDLPVVGQEGQSSQGGQEEGLAGLLPTN